MRFFIGWLTTNPNLFISFSINKLAPKEIQLTFASNQNKIKMTNETKKIFDLLINANYELHTNEELSLEEKSELQVYVRRLRSMFKEALGGEEQYQIFMDNGRKMFASNN